MFVDPLGLAEVLLDYIAKKNSDTMTDYTSFKINNFISIGMFKSGDKFYSIVGKDVGVI